MLVSNAVVRKVVCYMCQLDQTLCQMASKYSTFASKLQPN